MHAVGSTATARPLSERSPPGCHPLRTSCLTGKKNKKTHTTHHQEREARLSIRVGSLSGSAMKFMTADHSLDQRVPPRHAWSDRG